MDGEERRKRSHKTHSTPRNRTSLTVQQTLGTTQLTSNRDGIGANQILQQILNTEVVPILRMPWLTTVSGHKSNNLSGNPAILLIKTRRLTRMHKKQPVKAFCHTEFYLLGRLQQQWHVVVRRFSANWQYASLSAASFSGSYQWAATA